MSRIHERRFGVEIECGFGKRTQYASGRWEAAHDVLVGLAEEGKCSPYWAEHAEHDGTLIEFKSPILQGKAGFKELHTVMNTLVAAGAYVTRYDGMHVHHDAPEFRDDMAAVARLVESWSANIEEIRKFVAPRRYGGGRQKSVAENCPPWDAHGVELVKEGYKGMGRRDLNVNALDKHGTVEIRLCQGTLNPQFAEAWIRFGQAFLGKVLVLQTPMRQADDYEVLLKRIKAISKRYEPLHHAVANPSREAVAA